MTEQPPSQPPGVVASVLHAVKGLSLTNVLVIIMLAVVVVPGYLLWRLLNDPTMLGQFLSSYEEQTSQQWPCTLHIASLKGAGSTYAISAGFAVQGSEEWALTVRMERKPTDQEMVSYCQALYLLIDFMRNPDARTPTFPGTDEPLVHPYPSNPVAPDPP